MRKSFLSAAFNGLLLLLTACSEPVLQGSYADAEKWLCKPGLESNPCLELDQTITYVYPDARQVISSHITATNPEFDCFYLYPKVDTREEPGNTEELNEEQVRNVVFNQAARFTELCDLYVPFYRQMTAGTYRRINNYRDTRFYEIAYGDVSAAFNQYLHESGSRPFVLMGHSQGAHMLLELLERHIEGNYELQQRMISALVIGPLGRQRRPETAIVPDTFPSIPLCTRVNQTGCVITFDTVAPGETEAQAVDARPCVNPTLLGGEPGVLEAVIWPTADAPLDTPWVGYPGRYTAHCDANGYLVIDILPHIDEPSPSLQSVPAVIEAKSFHKVDFNWALGDLLRIVAIQAGNMPRITTNLSGE